MKKKIGSGGFSLVELLIGVTILAVIAVPLLHAFFTSSITAGRAREIRSRTVAAQNIIESYKAVGMADMIPALRSGTNPLHKVSAAAGLYDEAGGQYQPSSDYGERDTYHIGLLGVYAGAKSYNAMVTVDAAAFAANAEKIVNYKAMDAVYAQPNPDDADSKFQNPDVIAAMDIASQAQIDSGGAVSYTEILNNLTRKITITVTRTAGQAGGVVSCTALFKYDATYTYWVTDTDPITGDATQRLVTTPYSALFSYEFYRESYAGDATGISGLYFFYYPNLQSDTIEVLNMDNVPLSVVLVRQGDENPAYKPLILLREDRAAQQNAQLHYNENGYRYRYYPGNPSGSGWYSMKTFDGILVDTAAHNRLYGVTVALYEAGSGFDGEPLASFNASNLE